MTTLSDFRVVPNPRGGYYLEVRCGKDWVDWGDYWSVGAIVYKTLEDATGEAIKFVNQCKKDQKEKEDAVKFRRDNPPIYLGNIK